MTTPKQLEANRQNAQQCTGPKTADGKRRSSKNALRHGLRAELLPVIPGEDPGAWEAHLAGIVRDLAPAGPLEEALSERVALALWRLRRSAAYEAAVVAASIAQAEATTRRQAERKRKDEEEDAEEEEQPDAVRLVRVERALVNARQQVANSTEALAFLEQLPELAEDTPVRRDVAEWFLLGEFSAALNDEDPAPDSEDTDFLVAVGVPEEVARGGDPYAWKGWTAGMVQRALALFVKASKMKPEKLMARVRANLINERDKEDDKIPALEALAKKLRRQAREQETHARGQRMLPEGLILEKITRYEAHLGRQLQTALHTLERLQAGRSGAAVPPPAVLDVTVNGGEALALPSPAAGEG